MRDFRGKRVLITGAARGIGYHLAKECAAAGATLVLTDIDEVGLAGTAEELRNAGAEVLHRCVDVADRAAVEELARWIESEGGLDVLVNNAGLGHSGELANTSLDTWEKLLKVNLLGPLYHTYAFLPSMIARRSGHIVNVSSGQAFWRVPSWGAYAVIKLALGAFSELLHFELLRHDVRVTTVYPFMVDTGFYKGIAPKSFAGKLSVKLVPYYSMKPESVARIIFKAIKSNTRVERVTSINSLGLLVRGLPPLSYAITLGAAYLLAEREEHPDGAARPAA
jgi:short-subunit dehydrogenase